MEINSKSHRMKKWKKQVFMAFFLCFFAFAAYGCGDSNKKECTELIENFETSCNALDVDGILDCINPTISNPIKVGLKIGNMISGQVLDGYLIEILDSLAGGLTESLGADDAEVSEVFGKIQLTPEKYDLKSQKGTVSCTAKFEIGGTEITESIDIEVVKSSDEWYISGMKLNKDE